MISASSITKEYVLPDGNKQLILKDIHLDIQNGEFVTLFGPNGSGKTTLLNIIAGLDTETEGSVLINEKKPADATIGYVFQSYNDALFPWKTVLDNITYPLVAKGEHPETAKEKARKLLATVGLLEKQYMRIYHLSGGQRQLVCLCRALIGKPDMLILDEPCSSLDYAMTKKVGMAIQELWSESHIPALSVSHDIDEAIFLADRVIVMDKAPGKIKGIIPVPLPRPRTLDIFASDAFATIRSQVLDLFHYE